MARVLGVPGNTTRRRAFVRLGRGRRSGLSPQVGDWGGHRVPPIETIENAGLKRQVELARDLLSREGTTPPTTA